MQSGVTIELGIMYIPSESLMQLIDSIANLREEVFRDHRVLIMGPNSLAAYLISVHMGFRTIALNERASDIMLEFGKLKKEFENFSSSTEELDKNKKYLRLHLGQKLPTKSNRFTFEIVAEAEIAQHFEKCVVPCRITDVI